MPKILIPDKLARGEQVRLVAERSVNVRLVLLGCVRHKGEIECLPKLRPEHLDAHLG